MNKEHWRKLSDLPKMEFFTKYSVSNLGKVRNDTNNHILSNTKHGGGYYAVCITDDYHHKKSIDIHRLVALAFIPNPDNLPQVNHKDEDKSHNWDTNLEWCTQKYNNLYGTRLNRTSVSQSKAVKGKNNPKSKSIVQLTLDGKFVREYSHIKEAKIYGFPDDSSISACCKGNKSHYKGYTWKYKEDYNEQ